MKKLVFLAGAVLAGMGLPQLSIAQDRGYDGIDGGKPIPIEREPNTLNAAPAAPNVSARTPTTEARAARKAARARIAVRPRMRTAKTRRAE